MKYLLQLFLLCYSSYSLFSQGKTDLYIDKYSSLAVSEMKESKIPASITLSQGILESGNGTSRLAVEGNNHFGIKCHGWGGEEIYADDDQENECFRKYKSAKQSFKDHSEFLIRNARYSSLFDLDITDYKGWAKGLKAAGYATSPTYAENLISIIERYQLYQYDSGVPIKNTPIFVSRTYGFPFVYGVGLCYLKEDKYFINLDVSSSFIYSQASLGSQYHLFYDLYAGFDVNGIYHGYTHDQRHNLDFGISTKLSYYHKNRDVIISIGSLFLEKKIQNKKMIPVVSLTYLIN